MGNTQLIKKIKKLRQIKPNKDWVVYTKKELLGREGVEKPETSPFSVLLMPVQKPTLVLASLVMVAAILGGLFVWVNFLPQSSSLPVITDHYLENHKALENQKAKEQEKEIAASLEKLRKSLEQATADLNKLAESKDPRKALQMVEVVKIVAQEAKGTIGQINTPNIQSEEVLASLNAAQELEQAAENIKIGILIGYLNRRSLTTEQKELLEEAERYYNNGEYNEALSKALKASQIR